MLVIQNGSDSIKSGYLSLQLHKHLNNFTNVQVGEYTVDFTKEPIEITNSAGELVYGESTHSILHGEQGVLNEAGQAALHNILSLKATKYAPSVVRGDITPATMTTPEIGRAHV